MSQGVECYSCLPKTAWPPTFGSAVLELLSDEHITGIKVQRIGIPDRFIEHGSQTELRTLLGLHAEGIAASVKNLLGRKNL